METYGEITGPHELRLIRRLPGPIERVWAYLTEPAKRRLWLADGLMAQSPGGATRLTFRNSELSPPGDEPPPRYRGENGEHHVDGEILACDPPRLLSFTWGLGPSSSIVVFELTADEGQVQLVVTQSRLGDRDEMVSVAGGWHTHLGILIDLLSNRPPRPFWSSHMAAEAEYRRRLQEA